MIRTFLAVMLLSFVSTILAHAQECLVMPPPNPRDQRGGWVLPSGDDDTAMIHALVIYIDIPNDGYKTDISSNNPWAYNGPPEQFLLTDIIDPWGVHPDSFAQRGKKYNITTYYRAMSRGRLNIMGHAVYQRTCYADSFYHSSVAIDSVQAFLHGHPEDETRVFGSNPEHYAMAHVIRSLDSSSPAPNPPLFRWTGQLDVERERAHPTVWKRTW